MLVPEIRFKVILFVYMITVIYNLLFPYVLFYSPYLVSEIKLQCKFKIYFGRLFHSIEKKTSISTQNCPIFYLITSCFHRNMIQIHIPYQFYTKKKNK